MGYIPQIVFERGYSLGQRQGLNSIVGGVSVQSLIGYIGRIALYHRETRADQDFYQPYLRLVEVSL